MCSSDIMCRGVFKMFYQFKSKHINTEFNYSDAVRGLVYQGVYTGVECSSANQSVESVLLCKRRIRTLVMQKPVFFLEFCSSNDLEFCLVAPTFCF